LNGIKFALFITSICSKSLGNYTRKENEEETFSRIGNRVIFLCMQGIADAALTTIGTATYGGSDYKLIWDDDNNGNSVIWLDYTNFPHTGGWWGTQIDWAAGLGSVLTNISTPGYTVNFYEADWRLPEVFDETWGHNPSSELA